MIQRIDQTTAGNMSQQSFISWREAFLDVVKQPEIATPLKEASLAGDLSSWTTWLTAAVVASCDKQGWPAAARKHSLRLLPQMGQEYLGLDVMAFPDSKTIATTGQQWPLPLAVFELENVAKKERIEYSLWKVICLRTRLRVVFAYRSDWDQANDLVYSIGQGFIGRMTIEELDELSGETVIVIGSRGEGDNVSLRILQILATEHEHQKLRESLIDATDRSPGSVGFSPRGSVIFRETWAEAHATSTFAGNALIVRVVHPEIEN